MKEQIIKLAKKYDADLIGFASAERFEKDDAIFRILPETKTVICLAFRVLRGIYRGVEEGTTYYQYTTMGVENLEETVMPLAMLNVCNLIEDNGFDALPQRRHQTIMEESNSTNPEVDYSDIFRGIKEEPQMDFVNTAVKCGIGEIGLSGAVLTEEFGPFQRFCYILTDAAIEPTPLFRPSLCDNCGECVKGCPGYAISADGKVDSWRCAVYYNGANESKNPFMPPNALADIENRHDITNGTAQFSTEEAKNILEHLYFYPPAKHFYRSSICGRACDRACYIHLEKLNKLTKKFKKPFRNGDDWKLETNI